MQAILWAGPAPVQARGGVFPLAAAGTKTAVRVCKINGRDDTRKYLSSWGFVEGAEISLVCRQGGNLIADVKGARIALGGQMACRIMVCDI